MEKLNIETIAEIKKSIHAITVKTPMTIKIILFIMSLFLFLNTKIQQIIQISKKIQKNVSKSFLRKSIIAQEILLAEFPVELLITILPEITTSSYAVDNDWNSGPTKKDINHTTCDMTSVKVIESNSTQKPCKRRSYKSILHKN